MNILAFDTAFDACSVAAGRGLRSLSPSIAARNASVEQIGQWMAGLFDRGDDPATSDDVNPPKESHHAAA